jgi:Xaa-Pro aminopeptidase
LNTRKARTQAAREKLAKLNIDYFLVSSRENIQYLSGFSGSAGFLLVAPSESALFVDFRYFEQARKEAPASRIVECEKKLLEEIAKELTRLEVKALAFEEEHTTVKRHGELRTKFEGVKLIGVCDIVERLRLVKDTSEIDAIREAVRLADRVFEKIKGEIKIGMTEIEIAALLEYFMKREGATRPSFDSIVASGPNSSLPHAKPTARKIGPGDFLKMDFGAHFHGYCSDLTRTVVIGEPGEKNRKIYEIVLEAQKAALEMIKPGIEASKIDKAARSRIESEGYGKQFGHGLGHGVGLMVHEGPVVNSESKDVLETGMVFTVEPGIYIPGFGGVRIEDMVVVTRKGVEILTTSPKELTILGGN